MAATAEKFIFLTGEGYRIYSSIYSASAEEKFLTENKIVYNIV